MTSQGEQPEHFEPSYDISDEQVERLTARLIGERGADAAPGHRFVAIAVDGDSPYSNIGRHIERVVFEARFGNDAQQMGEGYGRYDQASQFFISIDREKKVASGVLRIIRNSPSGLKTLNDIEGHPFYVGLEDVEKAHGIDDLDTVWDVGTVAVLPEYRGGKSAASVQLYRAMYLSALSEGIDHLVSAIEDDVLPKMKGYLGIPFVPLAGAKPGPYMGSEKTHPVYGYVPDFYAKMSRHMRTPKGLMAHAALKRLVQGSEDDALILDR